MNEVAFVEKREADWKRLMFLCARADVSPSQMTAAELMEMFRLHRRASKDLSIVRTRSGNQELAEYLNTIVVRSYGIIYRPAPKPLRRAIPETLRMVADAGRRLRWFTLASAMLMVVGAVFSWTVLRTVPDAREYVIPPSDEQNFEVWKKGDFDPRTADESIAMTGFYTANNARVAIVTGSLAAGTFGIGTIYIMFATGSQLGALMSELETVGRLSAILTVLPHGVTELSGIVLAGAAGLRMGWALLVPGRRRRGASLIAAGKDATICLGFSAVMMFMAAPVEGYFSFDPRIPLVYKLLFAGVVGAGWVLFWTGYGRSKSDGSQGDGDRIVDGVHHDRRNKAAGLKGQPRRQRANPG